MAISRTHDGVFWTHNDSGSPPMLFAVDRDGTVLARVRVTDARNQDWEDIASGPCPEGTCLYIADTGDNASRRGQVAVYRVPEPALEDEETAPAVRHRFRYPDGPRDVEAVFVMPDQSLYLISKGRRVPIEVFRHKAPLPVGDPVVLERVQGLTDDVPSFARRVTGADVTPDGRLAAVRTQEMVQFFDVVDGRLDAGSGRVVNLRTLREPQGEAVSVMNDGRVALTSEAGPLGRRGSLSLLQCEID